MPDLPDLVLLEDLALLNLASEEELPEDPLAQDLVDLVVARHQLVKLVKLHKAQVSLKLHKAQVSVVSTVVHLPDHKDLASEAADLELLFSVEDAPEASVVLVASVAEEPAAATVVILTADNNNPVTVREGPVDMVAEAIGDLLTIEEIDFLTVYICAIREIVSANFLATISLSFINYIITLSTGF